MKSKRSYLLFGIFAFLFWLGWQWAMNLIYPPPLIQPDQEAYVAVHGGGAVEAARLPHKGDADNPAPKKEEPKKEEPPPKELPPSERSELIALGQNGKHYRLQAFLNSKGGSVQRIILPDFEQADREGLPEHDANNNIMHELLVPGVRRKRTEYLHDQKNYPYPDLKPGEVDQETAIKVLDSPSFRLFHYEKASDERPVNTLGEKKWVWTNKEAYEANADADHQEVVFEIELFEPFFVRIRKTFSLSSGDYHIGLKVDFEPIADDRLQGKKRPPLRYQIEGAHGLPIEGEWYTSTYRQAIVGFEDNKGKGKTSRSLEDAREVSYTEGGERQSRSEESWIRYAAVTIQYFASAIVVDNQQAEGQPQNFVEFARATQVGPTIKIGTEEKPFLNDLTIRAISEQFQVDRLVSHRYLLYHGPIKVRLLRQLKGEKAVDDKLVDHYLDDLHLYTLTDAPSNNAFGRFLNSIFWSDIVITFTNLIHWMLGQLDKVIPSLALCIVLITMMVRMVVHPITRRQLMQAQTMKIKMEKMAPELKKLQEKHKDDFSGMNAARMKLYREHGMNPLAPLAGCLPLLLQWPVIMGLYYALQESIFFRLDTFLWVPNLAAPDMLKWWGEHIPIISIPERLGAGFPPYLGPYLNILPIVGTVLMVIQQRLMMPATDDPQMKQQQAMMKWMTPLMGLFFFKMAAGLCLYFITSTTWALVERRLIPKPKPPKEPVAAEMAKPEPPKKPKGRWGRFKQRMREKFEEAMEAAQKQQQLKREGQGTNPAQQPPKQGGAPPKPGGGGGGGKKKKKKR